MIAVVVAATFAALWWDYKSAEATREEVEEVAADFIQALTDFSADTIETDVQELQRFAIGDFADEVDTFFGPEAIELIKEAEATSEGDIQGIYVQRLGDGSASIFALVSETITNAEVSEPQTDTVRIEIEMIETKADGWKVADVQILQAPGSGLLGGSEAS